MKVNYIYEFFCLTDNDANCIYATNSAWRLVLCTYSYLVNNIIKIVNLVVSTQCPMFMIECEGQFVSSFTIIPYIISVKYPQRNIALDLVVEFVISITRLCYENLTGRS